MKEKTVQYRESANMLLVTQQSPFKKVKNEALKILFYTFFKPILTSIKSFMANLSKSLKVNGFTSWGWSRSLQLLLVTDQKQSCHSTDLGENRASNMEDANVV